MVTKKRRARGAPSAPRSSNPLAFLLTAGATFLVLCSRLRCLPRSRRPKGSGADEGETGPFHVAESIAFEPEVEAAIAEVSQACGRWGMLHGETTARRDRKRARREDET